MKKGFGVQRSGFRRRQILLKPEPLNPDQHPMPCAAKDIVVSNKLGLHARPAMQFVDVANQFTSNVMVKKGGEEPAEADGKSVMQMIILAATEGTPLRIEAEGDDAQAAVDKLAELFEKKVGEED